jgi:hypothetical protein
VTQDVVHYLYFDNDCILAIPAFSESGYTGVAATISFKKGWNAFNAISKVSIETMT